MSNEAQEFGRRITAARESLGMTQERLAELLGASARAVWAWENGENTPRKKTRLRLLEILGLEGNEDQTRSEWPPKVRDLTATLGDLMAETLTEEELLVWRHRFITTYVQGNAVSGPHVWPTDVEVIMDIIGASLSP